MRFRGKKTARGVLRCEGPLARGDKLRKKMYEKKEDQRNLIGKRNIVKGDL